MSQEQCEKENLFRVSHCEPHLAFCVCLCSIKVSRPTSLKHTHTHPAPFAVPVSPSPKLYTLRIPFLPFLLHLPWLGPKGPLGKSVSLSVYVSLSLSFSLSISLPLFSSLFSPALLLCNLKPKSAKSFSCGFGSFQIPWPSPSSPLVYQLPLCTNNNHWHFLWFYKQQREGAKLRRRCGGQKAGKFLEKKLKLQCSAPCASSPSHILPSLIHSLHAPLSV